MWRPVTIVTKEWSFLVQLVHTLIAISSYEFVMSLPLATPYLSAPHVNDRSCCWRCCWPRSASEEYGEVTLSIQLKHDRRRKATWRCNMRVKEMQNCLPSLFIMNLFSICSFHKAVSMHLDMEVINSLAVNFPLIGLHHGVIDFITTSN